MSARTIIQCDICDLEITGERVRVTARDADPMDVHKGECLHKAIDEVSYHWPIKLSKVLGVPPETNQGDHK